jgi:hypothetical protein
LLRTHNRRDVLLVAGLFGAGSGGFVFLQDRIIAFQHLHIFLKSLGRRDLPHSQRPFAPFHGLCHVDFHEPFFEIFFLEEGDVCLVLGFGFAATVQSCFKKSFLVWEGNRNCVGRFS